MSLSLQDFSYELPLELIAQKPLRPRDHSRLLLLNKETGKMQSEHFYNIIEHLKAGDVLVLNNSKVFPARILAHKKKTGGKVEVFLLKKIKNNVWECLLQGNVKEGSELELCEGFLALVLKDNHDGSWQIKFNLTGARFWSLINKIGETPLPPYIKREKRDKDDKKNYQTVFASDTKIGSAAAPTAGFHLTRKLINKIKAHGVEVLDLSLHIGLDTFSPIKVDKVEDHKMHTELLEISAAVIKKIIKAKKEGRRIISLGTTSCRALESIDWKALSKDLEAGLKVSKQSFWTDIFIYPGYKFKVVDALITNFHLPKSSLLILVSALAGREKIRRAYELAIDEKYRFFSYGDAMFIY